MLTIKSGERVYVWMIDICEVLFLEKIDQIKSCIFIKARKIVIKKLILVNSTLNLDI